MFVKNINMSKELKTQMRLHKITVSFAATQLGVSRQGFENKVNRCSFSTMNSKGINEIQQLAWLLRTNEVNVLKYLS